MTSYYILQNSLSLLSPFPWMTGDSSSSPPLSSSWCPWWDPGVNRPREKGKCFHVWREGQCNDKLKERAKEFSSSSNSSLFTGLSMSSPWRMNWVPLWTHLGVPGSLRGAPWRGGRLDCIPGTVWARLWCGRRCRGRVCCGSCGLRRIKGITQFKEYSTMDSKLMEANYQKHFHLWYPHSLFSFLILMFSSSWSLSIGWKKV